MYVSVSVYVSVYVREGEECVEGVCAEGGRRGRDGVMNNKQ
jgi:hypothetical protein